MVSPEFSRLTETPNSPCGEAPLTLRALIMVYRPDQKTDRGNMRDISQDTKEVEHHVGRERKSRLVSELGLGCRDSLESSISDGEEQLESAGDEIQARKDGIHRTVNRRLIEACSVHSGSGRSSELIMRGL